MNLGLFPVIGGSELTLHPVLIVNQVAYSNGNSDTFDNMQIPQTFDHLMIYMNLRTILVGQAEDISIFFNNDYTAANYTNSRIYAAGSSAAATRATAPRIGLALGASNNTVDQFSLGIVHIPFYRHPGFRRQANSESQFQNTFPNNALGIYATEWNSNDPITRIAIRAAAGTRFEVNSRVQIFGLCTRPMPIAGI